LRRVAEKVTASINVNEFPFEQLVFIACSMRPSSSKGLIQTLAVKFHTKNVTNYNGRVTAFWRSAGSLTAKSTKCFGENSIA
jgi:hypothetical protein